MIEHGIEDFDRFDQLYEVCNKSDDTRQSYTGEVTYNRTKSGGLQEREASTGKVRLTCCDYIFTHIYNSIEFFGTEPWMVRDLNLQAASTHIYLVMRYLISEGEIKKISGSRYVSC